MTINAIYGSAAFEKIKKDSNKLTDIIIDLMFEQMNIPIVRDVLKYLYADNIRSIVSYVIDNPLAIQDPTVPDDIFNSFIKFIEWIYDFVSKDELEEIKNLRDRIKYLETLNKKIHSQYSVYRAKAQTYVNELKRKVKLVTGIEQRVVRARYSGASRCKSFFRSLK